MLAVQTGARRTPAGAGGIGRRTTTAGRFYDVDGEALPSVTTILGAIAKPALVKWAETTATAAVTAAAADLYLDLLKAQPMSRAAYIASLQGRLGTQRQAERELAKAAEIGTQTHALIEWTLRRQLGQVVGPRPATTPQAEWAFMAFEDWSREVDLQPLLIEQVVFSTVHGYAGTMDLLAKVRGQVTLIDFKTGKSIYAEAFLQNVAYQVALEEMGHGVAQAGLIVRLPKNEKDPAFEVGVVPAVAELFPTFLAVKQVWHWHAAAEAASRAAWEAKRRASA